ncbi:myosin light chain kinase 3 isoform X2 [Syngnathus acus]|uniref:myosin light chain kinase 3 isoform X2 n=1 Tax=Syngnathus acus TaxID=161584 RepID=UPI00188641D4|nr:myosin light chain kinase 3 isoform X2 [Syngnathus acus]
MSSSMKTTNLGQRMGDNRSFDLIQNRIESLSGKMDKLINLQEKVLIRLDAKSDVTDKEETENVKSLVSSVEVNQSQGQDVKKIYQEMSTIMSVVNQRSEIQTQKLEGMEKLVLSMQQVISFIGETIKSSRLMELMFKGPADSKANKVSKRKSSDNVKKPDKLKNQNKDGAEKPCLSLKAPKTMKPPDTEDTSLQKQVQFQKDVLKLNNENAEKSPQQFAMFWNLEADVPAADPDSGDDVEVTEEVVEVEEIVEIVEELEEEEALKGEEVVEEVVDEVVEELEVVEEFTVEDSQNSESDNNEQINSSDECEDTFLDAKMELSVGSGSFETEELVVVAEYTEVLEVDEVEDEKEDKNEDKQKPQEQNQNQAGLESQFDLKETLAPERDENKAEPEDENEPEDQPKYLIDTAPPPPAPFNHRIVSAKPNQIGNFYTINWQEVLGGGRFGQVHKCVENSSGLTLAAKVIKARSQKEKEVVKNEIQVMNNLDHANLIQLYAAYESRNDIILVLEYVGGGELFDRIIDENYTLMELDAVVFIRQICEGLQHMHKMYILHLDLKPENILCVSRVTNKIKIIDFGLARTYKPREKLRVNFGTPEFLAPEVINYDFVSFNTDMWSLGVITYMLLSGLCPFLGDDDNETLNNILACQWNFEEQEFVDTTEEAKEFITRLLVVNKTWRMGASEALRHPWLSDSALHHKLNTKKTMCRSRRSSCVPPTDS